MKDKKAIKVLILLGFVILLAGFVAFKSGVVDKDEALENNNQSVDSIPADSPMVKRVDTIRTSPEMLPTSKSLILLEQKVHIRPGEKSSPDFGK